VIFTTIKHVELPETAVVGTGFTIVFEANGDVPFAQIIVRHDDDWKWLVKDQYITPESRRGRYRVQIPPQAYHAGTAHLQI
jgi:hypothetical protein